VSCVASRDGTLETLDFSGTLHLFISDNAYEGIGIKIADNKKAQTNVSVFHVA